jgi:thiamine biosynthesis lipoprotein
MPPMITVLNLIQAGALATAVAVAPGSDTRGADSLWVERSAFVMGTVLDARVEAPDREQGMAALEAVFAEVRRLETVLSSWTAESEIGRLNGGAPGAPVRVSGELWELLREAAEWSERTSGAFDPGIGPLVDAWALRGEGRRPTPERLEMAREASGIGRWSIATGVPEVTRPDTVAWLDTGGFGKGAALRSAAAVLRDLGIESAYLDFGGQVLAIGRAPGGTPGWEIRVAHPARRTEPVAKLRLMEGSVASSSQSERFVEAGGERFGHVLDPRTGRPVPGGRSATVVAEDPMVADIVSTALLVMDQDAAARWAAERHDVGVLLLSERDGVVEQWWNAEFERFAIEHAHLKRRSK